MLLSFSCKNFKSFKNEAVLSMVPEKRLSELRYSILNEKIDGKNLSALSTSVIYGPNAAGKTSLINALSCFKRIVLRGNIRDEEFDILHDRVSNAMRLVPFAFSDDSEPVSFDISFTTDMNKFRHVLSMNIGGFLDKNSSRHIVYEQLQVNDKTIFTRTGSGVEYLELKPISEMLNVGYKQRETSSIKIMMSENLDPESLLLTSDFNSFCSKKIVNEIIAWFATGLMVMNSADRTRVLPSEAALSDNAVIDVDINKIAKEAGIFGSDFAYVKNDKDHSIRLLSVLNKDEGNRHLNGIDSELIESAGTLHLISIMPAVIMALRRGATFIVDEFDASLHPMIVMNIISIFHNDDVNVKKAQLIFNTHNPIYLDHKLLRRDEIKFVERDKETKESILYSLSDFKANGTASVRKTTDYMKNYFISRYGAIVDMDFTDIIKDCLKEDDGRHDNERI